MILSLPLSHAFVHNNPQGHPTAPSHQQLQAACEAGACDVLAEVRDGGLQKVRRVAQEKEVDVGKHEAPAVARVALLLLGRRKGRAAIHVPLRRVKKGARWVLFSFSSPSTPAC